jgi:hypothetical protein
MEQVTINIGCKPEHRSTLVPLIVDLIKGAEFKTTVQTHGERPLIIATIRSFKSTVKIRRRLFGNTLKVLTDHPQVAYVAYRFYNTSKLEVLGQEPEAFTSLEYITL